jgi:O-antigen/teichoic acid export membrane protein
MGVGSFLSAFISFGIFDTYENILNINFLYFFISSFAFLSINILGNLFKGYEKFNFLIYVNLLSFSISILYLIFNTEGDDYIVFNTWLIFCVLTIIQNFLFYLFIRKQIPNKSKDIDDLFSQSFQKYIYRLVYQLAIRADILIVYNLVDKQTAGYYATARLVGDIVGYIHQGFYPILVSRRPKENSSEFLIQKVLILLIGISGFLLINLLNPFLNSYFSEELIKFASYTVFGSSIFNLIIFKSAEVIGENKVPLSVIFLTINTLCIFILFYVLDINLGLKFLLSQILTFTIIYFINDKIFFGLISKNKNK